MSATAGQIIVALEGNVIQTVSLNAPVLTIGRTPDNNLALPHPMVSRGHAEIRLSPEGPAITDLGSSNGTSVAGEPLMPHQPRLLTPGVVITIGPFILTYQAAEQVAAPPPTDLEADPVPVEQPVVQSVVDAGPPPPVPAKPPRPSLPREHIHAVAGIYLQNLPVIFHDNDFLARMLLIFENIWEPLELRQDHIELYFDPRTCPAGMLPWLASWVDLPLSPHWPESRVRQLVAEALDLYRWRGTKYGLARMIEIRTGISAQVTEVADQPWVFRVTVQKPKEGGVDRGLLQEVIEMHKPAHAGYILEVES